MKNFTSQKIQVIVIFFSSFVAFAQPTIGVGFWLEPGERSTLVPCDTAGVVNGVSGANVTWNYTGLTANAGIYSPMSQFYWEGVNLSTAPFAHQYPNADGGYVQGDSTFTYVKNNSGTLEWIGFVAEVQGANVRSFYADGESWVNVPFTYQDMGTDNFSGVDSAVVPGFGKIATTFSGNLSWVADGHGTLQLPGMTYNNVLRIKLTRSRTTVPPIGGSVTTHNVNYLYFSPMYEYIILDIENITTDNPSPSPDAFNRRVFYASAPPMSNGVLPSRPVGLEEWKNVEFMHVFPNPANEDIHISIATQEMSVVELKMTDLTGKTVFTQMLNTNAGLKNNMSISVAGLASGVYTLSATTKGEVTTVNVTVK